MMLLVPLQGHMSTDKSRLGVWYYEAEKTLMEMRNSEEQQEYVCSFTEGSSANRVRPVLDGALSF